MESMLLRVLHFLVPHSLPRCFYKISTRSPVGETERYQEIWSKWHEQRWPVARLLAACPDRQTERSVHQLRDALHGPLRLAVCFKLSSAAGKNCQGWVVSERGKISSLHFLFFFTNFCFVCRHIAFSYGYEFSVKALGLLEGFFILGNEYLVFRIDLLRIC